MKVVMLHPPLYPVNYEFYNLLGKYIKLIVYQFGKSPREHPNWTLERLSRLATDFDLKVFGAGIESFKNELNLNFIKELKKDSPDIVVSIAFWVPTIYAVFLKYVLGFKFIILTDAIEATESGYSFLRQKVREFIGKKADAFISASNLTTDYLRSFIRADNIYLSIQTINVREWRKKIIELPPKDILRKKLKLDYEKKIILGVGNFVNKKNWLSAISAVEKVESALMILIGSGEERESYEKHILENSLENKILIMNRKEGTELKEYFKAADIFIFPSLKDQFGYVVLEALASDLPVLCSKYAGASSLIIDGFNGYVIDPKKDFSEHLQNTINNLDEMKKNTYKSIEKLTLENRAIEFYYIFKKVLYWN
jgi:glycosyltransferase involved in cell wall biosynthesis